MLLEVLDDADVVKVFDWAHGHLAAGGSARLVSVAPQLGDLRCLTYVMGWPLQARSAAEREGLASRSRFASPGQVIPLANDVGLMLTLRPN